MKGLVRQAPTLGMSPEEAAAYWHIRQDRGDLTPAEQAEFDAWLNASPNNASQYARMERAAGLYDANADDPAFSALRQNALSHGPAPSGRRWKWAIGGALAASIAGALFLTGAPNVMDAPVRGIASAIPSNAANLATRKGEQRRVQLPDGSAVTLNTDTVIRLAFTSERRVVRLVRGQALFEVAHDPAHPFVVEAADRQITALGTVFEVRLDPGRMQVTLVEGKVVVDRLAVSSATLGPISPTTLVPGQELVAEMGAAQQVSAVDLGTQLRWREGFVEFADMPLGDAVAEINRYTTRPLVIADDRVGALRVSGVFRTGDPERFAAIVSELLPVEARPAPDRIDLVAGTKHK